MAYASILYSFFLPSFSTFGQRDRCASYEAGWFTHQKLTCTSSITRNGIAFPPQVNDIPDEIHNFPNQINSNPHQIQVLAN